MKDINALKSNEKRRKRWIAVAVISLLAALLCFGLTLGGFTAGGLLDDWIGDSDAYMSESGILITHVESDSPAFRAGLIRGDIILVLDGESVSDPVAFQQALLAYPAGATVTLTILHGGRSKVMRIPLGETEPILGVDIIGVKGL